MKACSTCEHYAAMAQQCRAGPPSVFVVGVNHAGQPVAQGFFPPMPADGWCGKWESDSKMGLTISKK